MSATHDIQALEKELRERSVHLQIAKESLRAASDAYRVAESEFLRVTSALQSARRQLPRG